MTLDLKGKRGVQFILLNIFPKGYIQVKTFYTIYYLLYYVLYTAITTLKYKVFNNHNLFHPEHIPSLVSSGLSAAWYLKKPRRQNSKRVLLLLWKILLYIITHSNSKQHYIMKGSWPLESRRFFQLSSHTVREALLSLFSKAIRESSEVPQLKVEPGFQSQ